MESGATGVHGAIVLPLAMKRGSQTRAPKQQPGTVRWWRVTTNVWARIQKRGTASHPNVVSVSLLQSLLFIIFARHWWMQSQRWTSCRCLAIALLLATFHLFFLSGVWEDNCRAPAVATFEWLPLVGNCCYCCHNGWCSKSTEAVRFN